jgi:transcriptional regulator with GAF, ATPase, and Fis domain
MQRWRILLDVWREACRHIEIHESTLVIAGLLARQVPLGQIIVRRVDPETASIVTLAAASAASQRPVGEHRRDFSADEFRRLVTWARSGRLLRRGKRLTGALGLVLPPDVVGDVLAAPLVGRDGPEGALLLVTEEAAKFEDSHLEMLDMLREPFSVALENDQRLHEMTRLREAAEADRGALLRRLGRTDLGETIIGEKTGLKHVMERVELVSPSDVPVLILGETGTGKELIARALHVRGSRHQGPFIRVNCGAIPPELIDSQLFGHEKGSFTGAEQSRQGWFERADGGTLFLDEIGELPWDAQVRFLRVLQDRVVERVGGTHPIHVEVRVVAATHRDLAMMVRDGRFREDLWYRLAVFPLLLPPLRERREDIRELAHHFAERAAARFTLPPANPSDEDIALLQSYDWPGNIRELGSVIDRAAILGNGKGLEIAKALGSMNNQRTQIPSTSPEISSESIPIPRSDVLSLDMAMRSHIERVLALTEGRIEGRRGAATLLKINPHTLRARMRKLGIVWSQFRPPLT